MHPTDLRQRVTAAGGETLSLARVISLTLAVLIWGVVASTSAAAVTAPVFGPEDFVRQTGAPEAVSRSFSAQGFTGPFLMRLENGGSEGTLTRSSSAEVTLNGEVIFGPSDFNQTVELLEREVVLEPSNELTVEVRSIPGSGFTLTILGEAPAGPPGIRIADPFTGLVTREESIDVAGILTGTVTAVEVNATEAVIDGATFLAQGVLLEEGTNRIVATASNSRGETATDSISVRRDTSPPLVVIETPGDGDRLVSEAVTVAGTVNDIIPGATVNEDDVTVTVNGVPAPVLNRTFLLPDLPLEVGENTITVEAEDRAGNLGTSSIIVTREPDLAGIRLLILGGNNQRGSIGDPLSEPLAVQVLDQAGQPLGGRPLIFAVSRGDGLLDNPADNLRQVTRLTDNQGRAAVDFQLGSRTGEGFHRVRVTTPGSLTFTEFCATAEPAPPATLSITLVPPARGVAGQKLPVPLSVIVTDVGGNPVPEVEVTFRVEHGGGSFGGSVTSTVALTDPDGIATVEWTLGPDPGVANNEVSATFEGNPGLPATFIASGLATGRPEDTRVSGIVQNSAGEPIVGALAVLRGTARSVVTGPDGRFTITGVPPGGHRVGILGSAANDPGLGIFYPDIDFAVEAVAGADNELDQPVVLPFLDLAGARLVGGDEDVILEMQGVSGFAVKVFAHSVILPDGTRGEVLMSSSQVKFDKVPMPPPQGSTPLVVGTLQPAGIRFDPPAQVIYPNVEGLAPGDVADIFAFHHDIGQFVNVGPGTVSEDGSVVVSDPGFGIVQSGWHCLIRLPGPAADCANDCSSRVQWSITANGTGSGSSGPVEMAAVEDPAMAQEATVTVTFSPGGGSNDASPEWSISDASIAEIVGAPGNGNSVTLRALDAGTATLISPVYRIPLPPEDGGDKTCQLEVAVMVAEKELVIEEPEDGDRFDITAVPAMPEVMARAVIRGLDPDPTPTTTFEWTVQILFNSNECPNGRNRNLDGQPFMATTTGGDYMPQFPEIRGGELRLTARAEVEGMMLEDMTMDVRIRGTNPSRAAVQAALPHDILRRLACQENGQRQFNAAPGAVSECPTFSGDRLGGVGVMQLTVPAPTSEQIWNWRENVRAGVALFQGEKARFARILPGQVRSNANFLALVNAFNQARIDQGLPPITVTVPEFTTTGDFSGTGNLGQRELDNIRAYNGLPAGGQFGRPMHEFRVQLDAQGGLVVGNIDPATLTGSVSWERVPVADRPNFGDPNYVNNVLGQSPQCGG